MYRFATLLVFALLALTTVVKAGVGDIEKERVWPQPGPYEIEGFPVQLGGDEIPKAFTSWTEKAGYSRVASIRKKGGRIDVPRKLKLGMSFHAAPLGGDLMVVHRRKDGTVRSITVAWARASRMMVGRLVNVLCENPHAEYKEPWSIHDIKTIDGTRIHVYLNLESDLKDNKRHIVSGGYALLTLKVDEIDWYLAKNKVSDSVFDGLKANRVTLGMTLEECEMVIGLHGILDTNTRGSKTYRFSYWVGGVGGPIREGHRTYIRFENDKAVAIFK